MAYRWLGVLTLLVACSFGCENSGAGGPRGEGGLGGLGGAGGSGGSGGDAGDGGSGGTKVECVTGVLCLECPSTPLCETSQDCSTGHTCIESGCDTLGGAPISHCVFAGGGACETNEDCAPGRVCVEVPSDGMRCVKTTPGCDSDFDCVPGFQCEEQNCVDRRVPCILDEDCPKSHFCHRFDATSFCQRVHQTCGNDFECAGIAPRCADVDGDGIKECAGVFDPNAVPVQACVNTLCAGLPLTPVCEVLDGGFTDCGEYGLCTDSADCAAGFECVDLWLDGRSECVPTGGSCSQISECPPQQVCASPRGGGVPDCQTGYQP